MNSWIGPIQAAIRKTRIDFFPPDLRTGSVKTLVLGSSVIIAFLPFLLGIIFGRLHHGGHIVEDPNLVPMSSSMFRLPLLLDFYWLLTVLVWQMIVSSSFVETLLVWSIWGAAKKHRKSTAFITGLLIVKAAFVVLTRSTSFWIAYSLVLNGLLHLYSR